MKTKYLFAGISALATLFISCECEEDTFGEDITLVVPMTTSPMLDTFNIGDTLWLEINLDKNVEVLGHSSTLFLEDFEFFSEFYIHEISGTEENSDLNIEFVEEVGEMRELLLSNSKVYPLIYQETDTQYQFRAGVVLNEIGLYYAGVFSSRRIFDDYTHPAMYTCDNNHRNSVRVYYDNPSTKEEAYEELFLSTGVDYLKEIGGFEDYASGTHFFRVVE